MPILTDEERCGTELAGKYYLDSVIGRGGMGVVFRGHHLQTRREVAIKILRPELSRDETLSRRFIREARAASALRHPNVVEVLDLGFEADGTAFMVLELLEGESLADLLQRRERLSPTRTLEILLPVMDALTVAHEMGIIHRDLKPDNVFLALQHNGQVKPTLLDFGIAKLADSSGSFATRTGSVMGTPHYMSPEQARGASDQTATADIWAMGVIAYHCLSGELPFDADAPTLVMIKVITEEPPSLAEVAPDVPEPLVRVVGRAMRKTPAKRYSSMASFTEALREAASQAGLSVPRPRESLAGPLTSAPPPADDPRATRVMGGFDSRHATAAARPAAKVEQARAEAPSPPRAEAPPPAVAEGARASEPTPPAAVAARRERGGARWPWAVAALAIPLLGLATWALIRSDEPPPAAPPAPPGVVRAEPAPPPPPTEPETEPPVHEPPAPLAAPEPAPRPVAEVEPPRARRGARRRVEDAPPASEAPQEARPERTSGRRIPGVVEW